MKLRVACIVVGFLSLVLSMAAQTSISSPAAAQVPPPLIQFSNLATDEGGNTLSGVVGITFSLYNGQRGGEALWTEMQNNVQLDSTGHYSVQLGITQPNGVPTALFTTGEARWLGVQIAQQIEQPRVLLLSVPYALKAGDAATIGGLPPSAFVLAGQPNSAASTYVTEAASGPSAAPPSGAAVTGTGTVNFVPLWDSTSNIINSVLFQSGTGSTARIGVNTATPASTLDVKGAGTIRGTLSLPAAGTATPTKGANSQPLNLGASAFNSTTSAAVNQTFQWQAEPAGNDTNTPSGTLNLLFGAGATKPAETGLHIASNGQIVFVSGQTFPGTGTGTITGLTTAGGSGLAGGGTSGTLNLSVASAGITNAMLANSALTVAAGTDLTGGGSVTLGSSTTLNLDTTKVPQLATANTFTGSLNMVGDTRVDFNGLNLGSYTPGVRFGSGNTGEAISSDRKGTINTNGIDFYTGFTPRMSVTNSGSVGIGTQAPGFTLDVRGTGSFSNGVSGTSSIAGANGVYGNNSATSGSGTNGVYGSTSSPAGAGSVGVNFSSSGYGVYGQSNGRGTGSIGVYGTTASIVVGSMGVYGAASGEAVGVFGQNGSLSSTGASQGSNAGVLGDAGTSDSVVGVQGTADDNTAAYFVNNSPSGAYAVEAASLNTASFPFIAGFESFGLLGSYCNIDNSGDLNCTGTKNAVVPIDGGARKVAMSAIESPKNWFEDFGSAQLVSGSAVVALDADFIQTVNTEREYMVIPVPNGECKGLYVTNKKATSFEVRELGGGTSSIRFDYRIVALRRKYEDIRFADHTNDPDPSKMLLKRGRASKVEAGPVIAPVTESENPGTTTQR